MCSVVSFVLQLDSRQIRGSRGFRLETPCRDGCALEGGTSVLLRYRYGLPMSSGTTRLTTSTGIAKPMPALVPDGEIMAVFTPITRPAEPRSGTPELPGP